MLSNDKQHLGTGLLRRLPPPHVVALVVVTSALIVAAMVATWLITHPHSAAEASPVPLGAALDPAQPPEALVFVSGAVAQPGLYRLSTGARVADAIAAAGGITPEADPGRLPNLSARIHDGHQINVPFLKRTATGIATRTVKLDLNTATLDELRAVPAMPMGLAEAIVDARGLLGAFRSLSDLHLLLDVDSQTLASLRPYVTVTTRAP